MGLFDAEHYDASDVFAHPSHVEMQSTLANLIQQLRDCDTNEAGVAFQHDLRKRVLKVQADRAAYKRTAQRVARGKTVLPEAPEPQSGRDVRDPGTWIFEQHVCERLDRQLRSIGDALAWRVFQFHRPFILALCQNDDPGYMYGKAGLPKELEEIDREWQENGFFALQHDLTRCLRIGDITVFNDAASPETREIKTNPNRMRRAQIQRVNAARAAVLHKGPLSERNAAGFLYELDLPLRTHLDLLAGALGTAASEGVCAITVPGSRVILAIDQFGCAEAGLSPEAFPQVAQERKTEALVSAGINGDLPYHVHSTSLDRSGIEPTRVPWANYPLHPALCARLIGDYASAIVETSGPSLAKLLQVASLDAEWVRPSSDEDLQPGEVVMLIHRSDYLRSIWLPNGVTATPGWTLQMHRSELDRYLSELVVPGTWVAGIKYLLRAERQGQPWPHFRNEHEVWV